MSNPDRTPRIETLSAKKLIGMRLTMSLSVNKTGELWQSFMPRRKEIQNGIGTDLYSMKLYDSLYFTDFNPGNEFDKMAAVEVSGVGYVPDDMKSLVLPGGLYAVFMYHGSSNEAAQTFQFILGQWLPQSDYTLDDRPHFEKLGEKYKNADPDSEEEIWIPIKLKE